MLFVVNLLQQPPEAHTIFPHVEAVSQFHAFLFLFHIYGISTGLYSTFWLNAHITSCIQFSSVAQSCLTLCDPMIRSMPGLPVHHQLPEFTWTQVHWVSDDIEPSSPLSSPSPPAPNPSQHQRLFQLVNSSHEVAKVLEFQL